MAVKASQSATRVLAALEAVAAHQPVGISALAKLLQDDRSAVQRAVATLADAGWIRVAPRSAGRWELSAHMFTLAHLPGSTNELRRRARAVLESLRSQTGETVFLAIPDFSRFVIIETIESEHLLRMTSRVGQLIAPLRSATGRAFLAQVDTARRDAMLGGAPDAREAAELALTKSRGYAVSAGEVTSGATNLAAAIFSHENEPVAVLAVSGPSERMAPERYAEAGAILVKAAASLSHGR